VIRWLGDKVNILCIVQSAILKIPRWWIQDWQRMARMSDEEENAKSAATDFPLLKK